MDSQEINKDVASHGGTKYRFDGFEIDPPNRTLSRNGRPIYISGKAFDVLIQLVENAGRLVSKDELIQTVWSSSYVEEGSVARTVSKLRKILGDEGKEHKYITTVQGHGYRFVGDLENTHNGNASPANEHFVAATGVRYPAVLWTLVVVVLTVGAGLALSQLGLTFQGSGSYYFLENSRLTKLTQTGDVYSPRISLDGQYVAYISTATNSHSLTVRHNASGSALTLVPDAAGIWALDIAPSNTFLYYIQKQPESEKGDLFRIPLLGGVPFKVAELANGGLTISPDGTQLAFVRIDRENRRCSIIAMHGDGTNARVLHSISFEDMYHALDWAPDGKSLGASIKVAAPGGIFRWYLAEITLDDGAELQIGNESEMLVTGLDWLPDKSGLIANAIDRNTKQSQIYHVSYPDGLFRRITNDLDHYQGVSLTADGRQLVTMKQTISRQIWSHADGKASRLTIGDQLHIDSVDWIGDDSIAFSEDVNGTRNNYNIWRMRSDGSEKQQLTFGGGYNVELTVSPDKRHIAFISRRSGRDQVWRVGTDGSDLVQLTNLDYNVTMPMFSADSRKVYFLAWVEAALHLFHVPVEGGEATLLLDDDIYRDWAPSPDGKRVAYLTLNRDTRRRQVSVFSLETMKNERVLDMVPETCLRWTTDSKALFFTSSSDGARNIWRSGLGEEQPETVTAFADERIFRFAVSQVSGHFAVVRESITYDAIMLTPDSK